MNKLLFLLFILSGCSSISKEECASQNWFDLGKSDASSGIAIPKTNDYKNDCFEYGIEIKEKEYLRGFEAGVKSYCTFYNGLDRGESGGSVHSKCEELSSDFKLGYRQGLSKYQKEELKNQLISNHGGQECSSAYDCVKAGSCINNKCLNTGSECSFDSECINHGSCTSVSGWTQMNDLVSVNICTN